MTDEYKLILHRDIYTEAISEVIRQMSVSSFFGGYCRRLSMHALDGRCGDKFLNDPTVDSFTFAVIDIAEIRKDQRKVLGSDVPDTVIQHAVDCIMGNFMCIIPRTVMKRCMCWCEVTTENENPDEIYITLTVKDYVR